MNKCRRCGKTVGKKELRCKECRKYVDSELRGENSLPRAFYFSFYLRFLYKKKG